MPANILLIDDEPDMLVMLEMLITSKTPHHVVSTNNPLEIEHLLAQQDFNLVITDLKMPMMDGIEVLELVKKKDADIPVIVITAFGTLEAAEEAVHRGAYDFITKPFRKEQILVAVDRALEWQRIVQENRRLRSRMEGSASGGA
ncbi:MAG: response regulator [Desulfobaccales bacterium]